MPTFNFPRDLNTAVALDGTRYLFKVLRSLQLQPFNLKSVRKAVNKICACGNVSLNLSLLHCRNAAYMFNPFDFFEGF